MKHKNYHEIRKRIDMDLLSRSSFAIAVHCIIYPAMFYPHGLYQSEAFSTWAITIAALSISAIRVAHIKLTGVFYDRFPGLWMHIFTACSFIHAAILSILFVLVSSHPGMEPAFNITMVVCAGMASAAISSLSPKLFLAICYPLILLFPGVVIFMASADMKSTGLVVAVYMTYLFALAFRTNKEYLRTFDIEQQLNEQKKELETLSRTDALTGLHNRGHFNTLYEMIWDTNTRNKISLTLMLLDIDYFKKVNDTHGHISGDVCLKVIADILNKHLIRKTDIISRYGGEEFAALLSNTPIQDAEKVAQKIKACIEDTVIENGEHQFRVTASFGIASILPSIHDKPIQLIEHADLALYQAKKSGRNCIKVYSQ